MSDKEIEKILNMFLDSLLLFSECKMSEKDFRSFIEMILNTVNESICEVVKLDDNRISILLIGLNISWEYSRNCNECVELWIIQEQLKVTFSKKMPTESKLEKDPKLIKLLIKLLKEVKK